MVDRSIGGLFWMGAVVLVVAALSSGCAVGVQLRTRPEAVEAVPQGTYTLLLYGCGDLRLLDNAALLVPEGRGARFEFAGPGFATKTKTGVPRDAALAEADRFLECAFSFTRSSLRAVQGPEGKTLAYEVRPLYSPLDYGRDDVLTINYSLGQDGKTMVYVWLDQDIERLLWGSSDPIPGP